jgi:hypothetical protein
MFNYEFSLSRFVEKLFSEDSSVATFGIIQVLKRELPLFGCPAGSVAAIAQISASKLSAFMSGAQRPSGQDETKLYDAWSQIKKLARYADPLPLNFSKVDGLRDCIQKMTDGSLKIVVFQSDYDEALASQ